MTKSWVVFGLIAASALTSACATGIDTAKYNNAPAKPDSFVLCHGYSCTHKTPTGFTSAEWKAVGDIFTKKPARTPPAEREKIGKALAKIEHIIGAKTGTDEDDAMAVSIKTSPRQMDCIDETVNTTHYIEFMDTAGWLKFHRPALPTHRGYIFDGRWPHNTAVIEETTSRRLYAVDSFYRPNGGEPYILPREQWLAGWKPPGANQ